MNRHATVRFIRSYSFIQNELILGRLFRRSIERMQPEIAHVPMNLHLQQLLVSNDEDPSQSNPMAHFLPFRESEFSFRSYL